MINNTIQHVVKFRADLFKKIRLFFEEKKVTEVDAPILSTFATVDPHIDSLSSHVIGREYFLHTSPEFHLKKMLAAGCGDIYSLGKVFRQGEKGRRHQPEFTMLEWYRIAWSEHELMLELESLIKLFLSDINVHKFSYREIFLKKFNIDPHRMNAQELESLTRSLIDVDINSEEKSVWLDLLMSHCIEPDFPSGLVFVYDYPKEQAALARLGKDGMEEIVARRFEAYLNGMELANGYFELTDANEQLERFKSDQYYRELNNLPVYPYDQGLVDALSLGLPDCAGVALGVDRLLMVLFNTENIEDVIPSF